MKTDIKYILIFVLLTIVGIYLFSQKNNAAQQRQNMENTNKNPIDQSHRGYEFESVSKLADIKLNEPTTIKYKIRNDKREILRNFEITHEKLMHFIIVRKDLMQFQHLHPTIIRETGEFSVDVTFTVEGPYRFFADFTPGDNNPQKLPVTHHNDLNVGDVSSFQPHPIAVDTQNKRGVPPDYEITYTFPQSIKAQTNFTYSLDVSKNGQSVTDLGKYLGALGHSVILKEGSLDYIHTHPEDGMSGEHAKMEHIMPASTGPKIEFATTLPEAGVYKIFTQFQHQGKVITSEYVIRAN